MPEVDEVLVLRSDLEALLQCLHTVHSNHTALDLAEQYRKLDNRNRRSPLTMAIATQVAKVEAYLAYEPEDDDVSA